MAARTSIRLLSEARRRDIALLLWFSILGLLLGCRERAHALTGLPHDSVSSAGYITIRGGSSGNIAAIDSALVVALPAESVAVSAGRRHIVVQSGKEWSGFRLDTAVTVGPGAVVSIEVPGKHPSWITSEPAGARVESGSMLLGRTPLRTFPPDSIVIPLRIALAGYDTVVLGLTLEPVVHVRLRPASGVAAASAPVRTPGVFESLDLRTISITGAVASGIVSAWAKHHGNLADDEFSETGRRSARERRDKYDLLAGVTLGLTQAGIGLFTYLLLSE